jgi:hypothetical protein
LDVAPLREEAGDVAEDSKGPSGVDDGMGEWMANLPAWRTAVLTVLETLVLLAVGTWTLIGLVVEAFRTGWTMSGLLMLLHDKWRGAVILGILLLFRTLRDALDRLDLKTVKTPLGDVTVRSEPMQPIGEEKKA